MTDERTPPVADSACCSPPSAPQSVGNADDRPSSGASLGRGLAPEGALDKLCDALADAELPVCAEHPDAIFVCPECAADPEGERRPPQDVETILRQCVAEARSQFDYKDETEIRGRIARLCPWLSAHSVERMIEAFCAEIEGALEAAALPRSPGPKTEKL